MRYLLLLSILLFSCSSLKDKRAYKKVSKAVNISDVGSRNACIFYFPIKSDTVIKERFIKGDTITILGDTIKLDCADTLYRDKVIYRKCPDSKIIVDTVVKEVQITVEDTRVIDKLNKENNGLIERNLSLVRWITWLSIICIISVALLIFKIIRK